MMLFHHWSLALLLQCVAAVDIATRQASSGCGRIQDFAGQTKVFNVQSNGGYRSYRLHLPTNYNANSARPLVIVYHGASNNPANFEKESQFANETLNPNMISVFPAGVNGNWQGPSYATPGVNDALFTTDLIKNITATYCIDKSRIYAAGYSNGGGFINTLACSSEHGGQFAAFAAFAAALYTDVSGNTRCSPSRSPLPMLEIHGTVDPTIPYNGGVGRGGPLPAVPEWLRRWAWRNNCTTSSTKDLGEGVSEENWKCAGAGAESKLRHIKMLGYGHAYAGASNGQFFATPPMLQYLAAHRKS